MYAQRIRRLNIRSYFLANSPEADDGLITRDDLRLPLVLQPPKSSKSTLPALGKWLGSFKISPRAPGGRRPSEQRQNHMSNPRCVQPKVLAALRVALSHWSQLEEIGLILHDYVLMPTFSDFLIDLWSQRGPSIRILDIYARQSDLSDFLEIFLTRLTPLRNLNYISMKLLTSQKHVGSGSQVEIGNKLAAFVGSHKDSLCTLIISEPLFVKWVDTPTLIQGLGCLQKLKRIELPVLMQRATFSRLEYLEKFLNLNARTLECLVMEYRPSSLFIPSPRDAYESLLDNVLPKLRFPMLSELDMEVYVDVRPRLVPFHLPPLRLFAPNLKTLILKGSHGYLTDVELTSLLENLSGGTTMLRSFCFRLEVLSPERLDQLALNLPMLESLSITYMDVSVDVDGPFEVTAQIKSKGFY